MKAPQLLEWLSSQHDATERTTTDLSREAGLNRQKVDRWLKGEVQTIDVSELRGLVDAFDLSLRELALRSNAPLRAGLLHAVLGADLPFDPAVPDDDQNRFVLKRTTRPLHSTLYITREDQARARKPFADSAQKLAITGPGQQTTAAIVVLKPTGVGLVVRANWDLLTVPGAKKGLRSVVLEPFITYVGQQGGLTGEEYRALYQDYSQPLAGTSLPVGEPANVWPALAR